MLQIQWNLKGGRNEGHGKRFPIVLPWLQIKPFAQEAHHGEAPGAIRRTGLKAFLLIMRAGRFRKVQEAPSALLPMPTLPGVLALKPACLSRSLTQTCQQKQWPFFLSHPELRPLGYKRRRMQHSSQCGCLAPGGQLSLLKRLGGFGGRGATAPTHAEED